MTKAASVKPVSFLPFAARRSKVRSGPFLAFLGPWPLRQRAELEKADSATH